MALWFAAIFAPVQIFIGDLHGLGVLEHQPTKLAAIEGNWDRQANMPLRALRDSRTRRPRTNRYEIAIPQDRQLRPDARLRRRRAGPQGRAAGRAAAGLAGLLLLPHHGRHRLRHAGRRPVEPVAALEGQSLHEPLVPARRDAHDAVGLRRRAVRLVHGRDRPPALCGLRTCCAPPTRSRPVPPAPSPTSLITFVVVYAFVFGFGVVLSGEAPAQRPGADRGTLRGEDSAAASTRRRSGRSRCPTRASKARPGSGRRPAR